VRLREWQLGNNITVISALAKGPSKNLVYRRHPKNPTNLSSCRHVQNAKTSWLSVLSVNPLLFRFFILISCTFLNRSRILCANRLATSLARENGAAYGLILTCIA
jgi:hypothetical protein